MKRLIAVVLAVVLLASLSGVALADKPGGWDDGSYAEYNGNGAPSGYHYTLNIIGVSEPKTADMKDTSGHTIFVPIKGRAKIYLLNSQEAANDEYCRKDMYVYDRNATDGDGATFCLPPPQVIADPLGDCPENYTRYDYSVYARALGTPNGSSWTTTCAIDDMGTPGDPSDDVQVCSSITMLLERTNGQSKFTDVSKYLLFIYVDLDGDGTPERYPIFDDDLYGYFWQYDNNGLQHAQLRFYAVATCIPDTVDYISDGPDCIASTGTTQVTLTGVGTHFDQINKMYVVDGNGDDNIAYSVVGTPTATEITLDLTPDGSASPATIYINYGTGSDKETVNYSFEVGGECDIS